MNMFLLGFEKRSGLNIETPKQESWRISFAKRAQDAVQLSKYSDALKRKRKEEEAGRKTDRKESKKEHKQRLENQEKFEEKDNRPNLVYEGGDVVGGKKLDKEREKQDSEVQSSLEKGTAKDEQLKGGLADGVTDDKFNQGQLRKGQKVETEHTDKPEEAKEIAKDHLSEDKKYYDKLENMEEKKASDAQSMLGGLLGGYSAGRRTAGTVSNMVSHEGSKTKNEQLARTLAMGTAPAGAVAGILLGQKHRQRLRHLIQKNIRDADLSQILDSFVPAAAGTAGGILAGAGTGALTGLRKSDTSKRRIANQEKHASKMKEVACVAVLKDGKMLMGKRRDNGKWTNPGGHLEEGEAPIDGAIRELYEEAGIKVSPNQMTHLATEVVTPPGAGTKLKVHAYKVNLGDKTPTSMKQDPDNEVFRWHWVNASDRNNTKIYENLHVPADKNVLLKALGVAQEKTASVEEMKSTISEAASREPRSALLPGLKGALIGGVPSALMGSMLGQGSKARNIAGIAGALYGGAIGLRAGSKNKKKDRELIAKAKEVKSLPPGALEAYLKGKHKKYKPLAKDWDTLRKGVNTDEELKAHNKAYDRVLAQTSAPENALDALLADKVYNIGPY
jgi:8-oxo-dGTP pyrophosphatase MutT (NUDIX family)/outer membrane lipoprotein SlyB